MEWYQNPKELAKRRRAVGLSQAVLAKRSGHSRSLVRDVELGRIKLRADLAESLWKVIAEERLAQETRRQEMPLYWQAIKGITPAGSSSSPWDMKQTQERISTLAQLVRNQDELIKLYQQLCEEKSAEVTALEKQVADLRSLYEAETEAALAHARAAELREKVEKGGR